MLTNNMLKAAHLLGDELVTQHGLTHHNGDAFGAIPISKTQVVAEDLTAIIAEILQSWLNAGSEREATMETLFPAMLDEVMEWT